MIKSVRQQCNSNAGECHFVTGGNSWRTCGVAYAARGARQWREAARWAVVTHRATAIPGEVVRALRCGSRGPTLAKITLQTRP